MGSHINRRNALPANNDADARRIMDSIRRIVQGLRIASRASEKQYGLSAAQLFVLQRLAETKSASVNELARRTLTHQSSVSVAIHRLVDRGFVQRDVSPHDARQVNLSLTPGGRKLVHKAPQPAQDRLIAAIHRLSNARRRTLSRLLEQLADDAGGSKLAPPLFFEDSHDQRRK